MGLNTLGSCDCRCDSCCTDCPEEFDMTFDFIDYIPACCTVCDEWYSGTFTGARTGSCTWVYEEPLVGNEDDGYTALEACGNAGGHDIVSRTITMTITCITGFWQVDIDYVIQMAVFIPGDPFVPRPDRWGLSTYVKQYQGTIPDSTACADFASEEVEQSLNSGGTTCNLGIDCDNFGRSAFISAV